MISDAPVRHYETTKAHAESIGAIAFFGDKYGDIVRVLEAGPASTELCGGTHVHALGFIGPIKIVSEGSIGSNLRRIEAVTGAVALARVQDEEQQLRDLAVRLGVAPAELGERVEKLLAQVKSLGDEVDRGASARGGERRRRARGRARPTAWSWPGATASGPTTCASSWSRPATRSVRMPSSCCSASTTARPGSRRRWARSGSRPAPRPPSWWRRSAKLLGGGTAKNPELVVGGGPKVGGIDDALETARARVGEL